MAQNACWESIPSWVTDLMNKEFTKALSLVEEIKTTISAMPKGKTFGKDGFPTQFFQENLEQVAPTLLETYKAMLH
jgi:hypothetical protein